MEELGLATCIHPDDLTPSRLFEEVRRLRLVSPAPLVQGRARGAVPLDGAERFADFFAELVASSRSAGGSDVTELIPEE